MNKEKLGISPGETVQTLYYSHNELKDKTIANRHSGEVIELRDSDDRKMIEDGKVQVVVENRNRPYNESRFKPKHIISVECKCGNSKLYSDSRGWFCINCGGLQ